MVHRPVGDTAKSESLKAATTLVTMQHSFACLSSPATCLPGATEPRKEPRRFVMWDAVAVVRHRYLSKAKVTVMQANSDASRVCIERIPDQFCECRNRLSSR